MLSPKTHIIFDVDGTLFDSIGVILDCFRKTFRQLHKPYPGDEVIKKLIGSDLRTIFAYFIAPLEIEEVITVYRTIYIARQAEGIALVPRTPEILKMLQADGKRLATFTMKKRQFAIPLFESVKIAEFFEFTVGAEDVSAGKPDPEGLLKILDFFEIEAQQAVFVGDALHDAHAARAAKMDFLGVLTGGATATEFKKEGFDRVFPTIYEAGEFLLATK